ncbi:hypothetical protein Tco_0916018 [Tanacetum coccineum]
MEDVESKLQSSQVNSQNGLESFAKLAVNVEGFKKLHSRMRAGPEFEKKVRNLEGENATLKLDLQQKESDMESQLRDQTSLLDKKNGEVIKLQKMVCDLNLSNANLNSMINKMGVDLEISKELNTKMDDYMSEIALEKLADRALHEYQISELNKKINDLLSQLPRP